MLYRYPPLDLEDNAVLDEIASFRAKLAEHLRVPRRWTGSLRRTALARAIRGSNSIEGIHVELDDAAAAVDQEEAMSADERTFAEIQGYRQALGYVLAMARDQHFVLDTSALRGMHFMMLSHDLDKSPGQYRTQQIYVHDERTEMTVYTGPDPDAVPNLMDELVRDLNDQSGKEDPLVTGAMAHLNLVMIHPFRDGNGRMARAVQTLVLAREGIAEPEFASIEEWLGANTDDYYRVLTATGQGGWNPGNDAHLWIKFNLRAHHMQAQTVNARWERASEAWELLDELTAHAGLPERVTPALYDAALGYRLRRSSYVRQTGTDERTASRDFRAMTDAGLLTAVGQTRGRNYVNGPSLAPVREAARRPAQIVDPYPWLPTRLVDLAARLAAERGVGPDLPPRRSSETQL